MLFSAATTFEAKRKGYYFIPYPLKVSPKSKIDFVKSKRNHWEPTEHSAVCSEHFTEENYTNQFADDLVRRLKRDEISIWAFLTKHTHCVSSNQAADKPESERSKRKTSCVTSLSLVMQLEFGKTSESELEDKLKLFEAISLSKCMLKTTVS